jgi:hypothetical protein
MKRPDQVLDQVRSDEPPIAEAGQAGGVDRGGRATQPGRTYTVYFTAGGDARK